MSRLLRSEFYRMTKTMRFWLMALVLALFGLVSLVNAPANAGEFLMDVGEDSSSITILAVSMLSAALVAIAFNNRTVYYEVMSGRSVMQILLSKCIVIAGCITLISGASIVIVTVIFGANKGYGDIDKLPLRMLLYIVVLLHAALSGVLVVTAFRGPLGVLICYMRFMVLDMVIMFSAEALDDAKLAARLMKLTLLGEPMYIFGGKVDTELIIIVVACLVFETLLLGGLSYTFMKKRLYK